MSYFTRSVEQDGYENMTAKQVKQYTVEHRLPRHGYELRAFYKGYHGWIRHAQFTRLGEKGYVFQATDKLS